MKTYYAKTRRIRGRVSYIIPILLLVLIAAYSYLQWLRFSEMQPEIRKQGSGESLINWKVYEEKKFGFSFEYPEDWEVLGELSNGSFSIWSKEGRSVNVQIALVFPEVRERPVDEKLRYIKEQYAGSEYEEIESPNVVGILYTTETRGSRKVPAALIVGEKETLYFGMENVPEKQWGKYQGILKEMVSSFKFTPED